MYCVMGPAPLGPLIRTAKEAYPAVTLSIIGAAGSRELCCQNACTLSGCCSLTDGQRVGMDPCDEFPVSDSFA